MDVQMLALEGAALIDTESFSDSRGIFARFFCEKELATLIGDRHFVNINYSKTVDKGAIRGLHFQYPPKAEMKLIRCIKGNVYDVMVDIRKDSPTFLNWLGVNLSANNMKMVCIPEGFAHGFQVLEDNSELLYMHSEFYSKEYEGALNYSDPRLDIKWLLSPTVISQRDQSHKMINDNFEGVVL